MKAMDKKKEAADAAQKDNQNSVACALYEECLHFDPLHANY